MPITFLILFALAPQATGTVVPKSMGGLELPCNPFECFAFVLHQDIPEALDKIFNDSFAQSLVAGRYS